VVLPFTAPHCPQTLLSPAAYSGLLEQQKRKLVALLPAVDRQDGIKYDSVLSVVGMV